MDVRMLQLNATKSEVAFFTKWSHEASFKPVINVDNKAIPFNPRPKLLGVRFDTSLTFTSCAEEVARAASEKTWFASSSWKYLLGLGQVPPKTEYSLNNKAFIHPLQ